MFVKRKVDHVGLLALYHFVLGYINLFSSTLIVNFIITDDMIYSLVCKNHRY